MPTWMWWLGVWAVSAFLYTCLYFLVLARWWPPPEPPGPVEDREGRHTASALGFTGMASGIGAAGIGWDALVKSWQEHLKFYTDAAAILRAFREEREARRRTEREGP